MTLLGINVGDPAISGVVVDRSCGLGSPILCSEDQVQSDVGDPSFRYGASRTNVPGSHKHYGFLNQSFTSNGKAGMDSDHLFDRLPVISHKYDSGGTLWTAIAACSPTVNVAIYNNIVARGNELASWQNSVRGSGKWGCTFCWAFHHECNNESGQGDTTAIMAANWRAAYFRILDIWETVCGVTIWQGGSDFSTTVEGLIPAINLVSGKYSGHDNDIATYWGNDAQMNARCVMYAGDPYNGAGASRTATFEDIYSGQKSWGDAKAITQAAAGRPFMQAIWETGADVPSTFTNGNTASWTATGLPYTKSNWLLNAAAYIKLHPELRLWIYYDDYASHPGNLLDVTQADWDGWLAAFCADPYWDLATDPLPGTASATQVMLLDDEHV